MISFKNHAPWSLKLRSILLLPLNGTYSRRRFDVLSTTYFSILYNRETSPFFETLSLLLEHFTEKSGKLRLFPLPICNFSRMQEKLEERYGTNYSHVPMIQHLGKHGLFQPVKKIWILLWIDENIVVSYFFLEVLEVDRLVVNSF